MDVKGRFRESLILGEAKSNNMGKVILKIDPELKGAFEIIGDDRIIADDKIIAQEIVDILDASKEFKKKKKTTSREKGKFLIIVE